MSENIPWDAVWRGDAATVTEYVHESLEVFSQAGRGRGVRTAAAIEPGALLLAELAVAVAPEPQLGDALFRLQSTLPELQLSRLRLLCDGEEPVTLARRIPLAKWPGEHLRQGGLNQLSLTTLKRMVDLNAYRCRPNPREYAFTPEDEVPASDEERHQNYGVFLLGSLVNHSCTATASKVLLGDWVFLRAARSLTPGEEVTQFYCDVRMPHDMRRKELLNLYGFQCDCARCVFEASIEDSCKDLLAPIRKLYSCCLPEGGSFRVSQLESFVGQAKQAAKAAWESWLRESSRCSESKANELWLVWPLTPVFSQLAVRLRRDGRVEEALELWQQAEAAVQEVVPLSNIHVRIVGERLLTAGDCDDCDLLREALRHSLLTTANSYGGSWTVWRGLVGFRMAASVQDLAREVDNETSSKPSLLPITCSWAATELDPVMQRRKATAHLSSTAFKSLQGLSLDASTSHLLVRAPGAADFCLECPFNIDVALVQPKFLSRKNQLLVTVVEEMTLDGPCFN